MRAVKGLGYGAAAGWAVGMLWWVALMVAFGPSVAVTHDSDGWHEQQITVLDNCIYAPVAAIPWAVVGGGVGLAIGCFGGWLEVATSALGLVGGIAFSLLASPFDGWLALTMPVNAFVGTAAGLAVGGLVRVARKLAVSQSRQNNAA